MKSFFGDDVLLSTETAKTLYAAVKDLPIVDYHCHLNEKEIRDTHRFANLGELWLAGDHYKWRSMRLCGVDEKYVTGDADFYEKYLKYAEIFPKLAGSPLYYWTQMELKLFFNITLPLNLKNAETIWNTANEKLKTMSVLDFLEQCKVEYVATTDDPTSDLSAHGRYGITKVCPTFRPDRMMNMDKEGLEALEKVVGKKFCRLADLKAALEQRLCFFLGKGCKIADHGMDFLPVADCGESEAEKLFAKRDQLTADEKSTLSSHLFYFLAGLYKKNDMTMQMHFATFRNVNTEAFAKVGRDAGYDIMRGEVNTDRLVAVLDTLTKTDRMPRIILYSLNPICVPALATLTGAFPSVRVGAAWWFNDTVEGIRKQLETVSEYAVLGTNLGMLTDSRSFASYARFDFFRRILADFVGNLVEKGEYDVEAAKDLMADLCYNNVKKYIKL